jgi:hypothetical protein
MAANKTHDRRAADEAGDGHAGIPRDADGNPIFLILPPGMQAEYDGKLKACEAYWQETGDPAAPMEALISAYCYRQPIRQLWLVEAICAAMTKRRTKRYVTRRYNATIRWMRYTAVRDAERAGMTWDDAYEYAAGQLAKTPAAALGPSMKADYGEVARDLKQGRSALYFFTPKVPKFGKAQARSR